MGISPHFKLSFYLGCALGTVAAASPAGAQATEVRLAAQPLEDALREVAQQTNTNILFAPEVVRGLRAHALKGRYTAPAAVARMLRKTGLRFEINSDNVILIRRGPALKHSAALQLEPSPSPVEYAQAAQSAPPAPASPLQPGGGTEMAEPGTQGGLEDIVVVAQRRSQRLQDVPISVTAVTAEQVETAGIVTSQDIAVLTPGLTITQQRNGTSPYLRGIGTRGSLPGVEPSVALYVDGVYFPSSAGSIFSLNNIERVEILKGPQGTLFGRNATGGLIHIITRDPSPDVALRASAGYGNYDTWTGNFYATGALAENVFADVSMFGYHQSNGFGTNVFLGNDVNIRREWMVRGKLKIILSPATQLLLAGDYSYSETDVGNARQVLEGTLGLAGTRRIGSIYNSNSEVGFEDNGAKQYGFSAKLEHEFSDTLRVTSTSAYRNYHINSRTDSDSTPLQISDVQFLEKTYSIQQELLVTKSSDLVDLTAGVFYFYSSAKQWPAQFRSTTPANNRSIFATLKTSSYAAFAQADVHVTERLTATGGLRYTIDDKTIDGFILATAGHPRPVGTLLDSTDRLAEDLTEREFEELTWRGALAYEISNDILLYGSGSRGFKSGGYNSSAPFDAVLKPEILDAYEVGFKSELLDRTLRVNIAGFTYTHKNIVVGVTTPQGPLQLNAAKGRINGLEAEVAFSPRLETGALNISGSLSILDAEYKDFRNAEFFFPSPAGGNVRRAGDATGNKMIRTPSFSSSVSVNYELPVSATLAAGIGATWQHTGKFYWDPGNRLSQPPVDLLNGNVSVGRQDDRWRVRFWVRNLLDEKYFVGVDTSISGDIAGAAAPRTYGVTLDLSLD